jgi:subtilisin family serine protease
MKARWVVGLVLAVFVLTVAAPATAGQGDKIVRTKPGLVGWAVMTVVCGIFGCNVVASLDAPPETTQPSSLFLVRGLLENTVSLLLSLLGIQSIEADMPVALNDDWHTNQATAAVLDQLWDRSPVSYYGTAAWSAYVQQPAADIVRLSATHCSLRQTGGGTVAIIDTGVDPNHPALKTILLPGYDFTRNKVGGDEMADLEGTNASPDGNYWVQQATAAVLDQATAAVLDDELELSAFGHGTMAAGAVHLVAPTARIMPLKAFGPDGQAYTSHILRAIYYATFHGAKVINMSFSRTTSSPELKFALNVAAAKGLVLVASAGNDGKQTVVYPAGYDNTIGVASTSNTDVRSWFSNYGASLVSVAAPGEGIITTYPFGSFAASWGTSFSTPLVSGTAALIVGMNPNATPSQITTLLGNTKPLTPELGKGRVDPYKVVTAARALWPNAPYSPIPATCASDGVDWTLVP